MNSEDFEEINENAHVGCGFIPKWKLKEIFGSSPVTAVQVRIFAPKLEIFKGMLIEKNGIDKIQLSTSMRKVQKSSKQEVLYLVYISHNYYGYTYIYSYV